MIFITEIKYRPVLIHYVNKSNYIICIPFSFTVHTNIKIIPYLEILDEKPIHHNTKYFLKYLEKKKSKRLALEHLNKQNNANLVMDIKLNDNIEESFNFANIIAEAIAEYKSWNTCKFKKNPNSELIA